jgi:hypothetical protein
MLQTLSQALWYEHSKANTSGKLQNSLRLLRDLIRQWGACPALRSFGDA